MTCALDTAQCREVTRIHPEWEEIAEAVAGQYRRFMTPEDWQELETIRQEVERDSVLHFDHGMGMWMVCSGKPGVTVGQHLRVWGLAEQVAENLICSGDMPPLEDEPLSEIVYWFLSAHAL